MRYDLIFITTALLCLLVGESLGIWMGVAHDFTFAPVHAHLNLLGWVTLAAYGLMHRAYPALGASRLAGPQCALAVLSSVAMPSGIAYAMLTQNPIVAIVAALGVFAATAAFMIMFVRKARLAV
ncbi:MAG TPA: hypothetical protein VEA80_17855 [Vitreimonas sp.]|uniref:hypothetical protein n=1 Tax=Vitreimonas sp. TaxID=3069702 RepID=UPI002D3E1375|nr:hypothetical protein [Vitreimonas sp.]HYD89349.1 hypothetical protein [Vitreimonas sp.]